MIRAIVTALAFGGMLAGLHALGDLAADLRAGLDRLLPGLGTEALEPLDKAVPDRVHGLSS